MSIAEALSVIAVSAAPVAELRGGIPLALSLGFAPPAAFGLGTLGNLIPVLPLLFGFEWGERHLRRWRPTARGIDWILARTRRKSRLITRFGGIGLVLLVAIPLPGTGVWTGAIAAYLVGIPMRRALPLIVLGMLVAAVLVLFASIGAFRLVGVPAV